jgi:hypothetical protein
LFEKNSIMKKFVILLSLVSSLTGAKAQNDSLFRERSFRFQGQVGINATEFIKQFLVLNNSPVSQVSPFAFNAKFLTGWEVFPSLLIGPRVGVGYSQTHEYSNTDQQDNERSSDDKSRSARFGIELQQQIAKRWIVYYGVDYVNATTTNSTVTTSNGFNPTPPFEPIKIRTEIIDNSKTTGFGPVLGVQFNINRWICLGTETSFYTLTSKGGTKTISTNPNNNNTPETFTDSKSTQFQLPFFINCNIVF